MAYTAAGPRVWHTGQRTQQVGATHPMLINGGNQLVKHRVNRR
jgi:hypothetical protein